MQKAKWEYENFLDSVLETIDLYETDNTFRKLTEPYIKEIQVKKLKFEKEWNECRTTVAQALNYIQNSGFVEQKFQRKIPFIFFSQIGPQNKLESLNIQANDKELVKEFLGAKESGFIGGFLIRFLNS